MPTTITNERNFPVSTERATRNVTDKAQTDTTAQTPDQSVKTSDSITVGRGMQYLAAESISSSQARINTQSEARGLVAKLRQQLQEQPENAFRALTNSLKPGSSALLEAAPAL